MILRNGVPGEAYNIPGTGRRTNIEVATSVCLELGKPLALKSVADRPGHDACYWIGGTKLKNLGYEPKTQFVEGLKHTVWWYKQNADWWSR